MKIIAHVRIYRNNSVIVFMYIKINMHTRNLNNDFVYSDLIYIYIQKYFLVTGIDFRILYIYVHFCIHVYRSSTRLPFRSDWLQSSRDSGWTRLDHALHFPPVDIIATSAVRCMITYWFWYLSIVKTFYTLSVLIVWKLGINISQNFLLTFYIFSSHLPYRYQFNIYMFCCHIAIIIYITKHKNGLKIPKGSSEATNWWTDNTMVKRKKGQKVKQRSTKHYAGN